MNVIQCNREQADKLLSQLFSKNPRITKIECEDEDGIYFITAKTNPGGYKTEWQYRPGLGLCFGEIRVGERRYDIYEHDSKLLGEFNKIAQEAIEEYERGGDTFFSSTGKSIGREIESGRIIEGNVLFAKIINASICICGAILIMIAAYNQWSQYGEYTVFSFLCSLFIHGGLMFMIYLGINWVIDRLFNKDNEEI